MLKKINIPMQQKKNLFWYFRLLAEETEKSLEDTQKRLGRREHTVQEQEEKILQLEERCAELNRVLHNTKDEAGQQRMTISSLDREKDGLQLAIDEKTEKIARLNEDLLAKVFFLKIWWNFLVKSN